MLISNPLKKLLKNIPKKLKATQVWRTWVKAKKVHISVTFLLITFFGAFFQSFLTDSKSVWNSAFFDTHIEFLITKIFFCSYYHFLYTLIANAQETLKKTENLFLWMCLRIYLCIHHRVCITKLLKLLYPKGHPPFKKIVSSNMTCLLLLSQLLCSYAFI